MHEIQRFGVTLKRLREDDLELVRGWRNDPKISQYMEFRGHISAEDQRRWFARINNDRNHYFLIVHRDDPIGVVSLRDIHPTEKRAEYGIFIYDDERLNSFVPIGVVMALLDFAFDTLGLETITAPILRDNVRSQRFNKAFGFALAEGQEEVENQVYVVSREVFEEKSQWLRRTVLRGFGE
jgi:UDP-4-amino-4,6-dideoxy-N-acetyl-beta-L-altrosamine N-acetyltransferase